MIVIGFILNYERSESENLTKSSTVLNKDEGMFNDDDNCSVLRNLVTVCRVFRTWFLRHIKGQLEKNMSTA